ncbi:MAG TPA: cytochrome d ubiquinol oxidase subunit II [Myxococcota bacterium]|nr:cytochrome d ubiquinol oxidase subunit II [Myxococcota bacterium]
MSWGAPEAVAAVMLAALVLYALSGGADFGGGVWDLLAFGPRAAAQRRLVERAIAPIWEANHVWLILLVVLLFTAFPRVFAAASIALHVPLTALLIGIVLRGGAFAFRQYGPPRPEYRRRWGRVFALASAVTPVVLGVVVGAVTSGDVRLAGGVPVGGFFASWVGVFPLSVGILTLSLFAFLAAVYLAHDASRLARDGAGAGAAAAGDFAPEVARALAEDFRRRALVAGAALGPAALAAALTAGPGTLHFRAALLGSPWSWPLQILTGGVALGAFAALWRRRFALARGLAAAQAALILAGWGLAQQPYLLPPDFTIRGAAAPARTLELLLAALAAGSVLLFPSLAWLYSVFSRPAPRPRPRAG